MFNKVIIPPVCVWGTLLDTKIKMAGYKISSEVNYAMHLAAVKADKVKNDLKLNKEDKKKEESNKNENIDENKENAVDVEFTEVKPEETKTESSEETKSEPENKESKSSILNQDEELTKGVVYGPDFSEFIEKDEPEEKPVTQADLDEAIKKMHENGMK